MKIINIPVGPLMVNSYIVWDEDTKDGFIVDPGSFDKRLVEAIDDNGIKLHYVILTHGHGDHICGVEQIAKMYSAKIVACEDELEMLKHSSLNLSGDFGQNVELTPDVLVKDDEHLQVGNMDLKFISTPGHTKGGMCILTDNYLFSGDTLFRASVGRTDFWGGSFEELVDSIKTKLFVLPEETIVLPGHMDSSNIGYEKKYNMFT